MRCGDTAAMIEGAATNAIEMRVWARAIMATSPPSILIGSASAYTTPVAMTSVPDSRIMAVGSRRKPRSKIRPANGSPTRAATQISDSTTPRSKGPMAYLSSSSRLNWMGMAMKGEPEHAPRRWTGSRRS